VFLLAINEASHLGHSQIEPEHLLLGLARGGGDVGQELFNIGLLLERLRLLVGRQKLVVQVVYHLNSGATRQLVKLAGEMAQDKIVKPEDLLLAIT
jgi:Clp amino terminal domain, pathogenicity island component